MNSFIETTSEKFNSISDFKTDEQRLKEAQNLLIPFLENEINNFSDTKMKDLSKKLFPSISITESINELSKEKILPDKSTKVIMNQKDKEKDENQTKLKNEINIKMNRNFEKKLNRDFEVTKKEKLTETNVIPQKWLKELANSAELETMYIFIFNFKKFLYLLSRIINKKNIFLLFFTKFYLYLFSF